MKNITLVSFLRASLGLLTFLSVFSFHTAFATISVPYGQSINTSVTWSKENGPYIVRSMGIAPEGSLTILPGTVVKFDRGAGMGVSGQLSVGELGAEPVALTSFKDDTNGGDSNLDASTTLPAAGDWTGIISYPGSHVNITNTILSYGGGYSGSTLFGQLQNEGGVLNVVQSTATNTAFVALQQNSGTTTLTHSTLVGPQYVVYMQGGVLFASSTVFDGGTGGGTIGIYHSDGVLSIHQSVINKVRSFGVYSPTVIAADMTENYWGDPSGPTASDNPGGAGASIAGNVLYKPFLGNTPGASTDPCIGVINCFSNVMFLPGLEASRLYSMDDPNCISINCENQLWEPNRNDDVRELYLDASGKSLSQYDIYTHDVLDEVGGVSAGGNIYKSFLLKMNSLKNDHLMNDWEAIPYDWRLSLGDILSNGRDNQGNISYVSQFGATTSPFVIQELIRLAKNSKTGKVTIVAHSNGGLVAKALMIKLGSDAQKYVDKIIFVAVPQSGTPQAIGALLNGFSQEIPDAWYTLPANGLVLSTGNARALAENMQSAYNLLPSQKYFSSFEKGVTPVISFASGSQTALFRNSYGNEIDTFDALQAFLRGLEGRTKPDVSNVTYPNVINSSLLTAAYTEHNLLDAWTPPEGVKVYQIAGWGIDTMDQIRYKQGSHFHCLGLSPCIDYDVHLTEDGDGTVVVPSALAMSTSTPSVSRYWIDLNHHNDSAIDRDHKDILETSPVLDLIKNIFINISEPLPVDVSSVAPLTTSGKKLRYFLHSPLSLDLYDANGHHVGVSTSTGFIESQIPGAYYKTFGEVKYITVPASASPHLILSGQASGYFTLDIEEVMGDSIVATTSFVDIPSSTSTKVSIDFPGGTIINATPLNVDQDGNGIIDFSLAARLNDIVTMPVVRLPLVVIPDNKVSILNSAIPQLTAMLSGFQNGDTASTSVTGVPSCTTFATATSTVGVYPIVCTKGTLSSDKYEFNFATGTLTIVYRWSGFLQPINDTALNSSQSLSVFKGGSTIPVKFQIKNASGTPMQSNVAPLWLAPQKGNAMSAPVDESTYSDPATAGTAFRYDPASQQYIYNWSTKGLATGYWYRIYVKLDDGITQSVVVGIR